MALTASRSTTPTGGATSTCDRPSAGHQQREDEEAEHKLPKVEQGEELRLKKLDPEQHFTEPPPRFTEATLVKALEEKGIGRPSTYAAIMTVIQDREYVERKEGRFVPTELGFIVNDLMMRTLRTASPVSAALDGRIR